MDTFKIAELAYNLPMFLLIGLGVFALIGFILGILTNKRKACYRWITSAIYFVLIAVLAGVLVDVVYDLPIGGLLSSIGVSLEGNTIGEIIRNYAAESIDPSIVENSAELIDAFAKVGVRLVYFIIMLIPMNFVYWLITQIIWWIFFHKGAKWETASREKALAVLQASGKKKSKDVFREFSQKKRDKFAKEGRDCVRLKRKKNKPAAGGILALKGIVLYVLFIVVCLDIPVRLIPDLSSFRSDNTYEKVNLDSNGGIAGLDQDSTDLFIDAINHYKNSLWYSAFNNKAYSLSETLGGVVFKLKYDQESYNLVRELSGLSSTFMSFYEAYDSYEKGGSSDVTKIKFDKVGDTLRGLAESEFVMDIAPKAASIALEIDDVKSALSKLGVSSTELDDVLEGNLKEDFKKLATIADDTDVIVKNAKFEGNTKSFETLKFASIPEDKVNDIFTCLSEMSIVVKGMDVVVDSIMNTEAYKKIFDKIVVEVDDIAWVDEFVNFGGILTKLFKCGLVCAKQIDDEGIKCIDSLDFGTVDTDSTGGVGNLFEALFASTFVNRIIDPVLEYVLTQEIEDDAVTEIMSLIDFSAISTKGWGNEINDLIAIIRDAKGVEKNPIIQEDKRINLKLLTNLSATTLLNSNIITDTIIESVALVSQGKGFLQDYADFFKVPDEYRDTNNPKWAVKEIRKYCAKEDVGAYKKAQTISIDTYNGLDNLTKEKFQPLYKIVGGEVYNLVNALTVVLNNIDLTALDEDPYVLIGGVMPHIETVVESEVMRASISGLVNTNNIIVIPMEAKDTIKVAQKDFASIKKTELVNLMTALYKMGAISTVYEVLTPFTEDGVTYPIGHQFAKTYFEENLEAKYSAFAYKTLGTTLDFNDLSVFNTKIENEEYTALDYLIGCDAFDKNPGLPGSVIVRASLSKMILDNASSITIPDSCKEEINNVVYIKNKEIRSLINSIEALGMSDVTSLDKAFTALFNAAEDDKKMETILSSQIIHHTLSKQILDIDVLGLNKVSANASITYYQAKSTFTDVKGNSVKEGELVTSTYYNKYYSGDNSKFTKVVKNGFESKDLIDKKELASILKTLKIIAQPNENGEFNLTASDLSSLYKDLNKARNITNALSNSVLLTYSVADLVKDSLASALGSDMQGAIGTNINARINTIIANDPGCFNNLRGIALADETTTATCSDQLYELFKGLNTIETINSGTTPTSETLTELDKSFVLRPFIEKLIGVLGYSATASAASRATAIAKVGNAK